MHVICLKSLLQRAEAGLAGRAAQHPAPRVQGPVPRPVPDPASFPAKGPFEMAHETTCGETGMVEKIKTTSQEAQIVTYYITITGSPFF